ncbi:MAG: hypothetical protein KOO62_04195 [candidate division Zixibacteria bacterium]|nr:hypothetical protein [candidate division Zixibacteria bacterium]
MRKIMIVVTALVAMVTMTSLTAMACGETQTTGVIGKTAEVTLSGTLVCLGCDLKKAEGARSECSAYGHKHALKTKDGRYVNLLENKYSSDLVKGEKYNNQNMTISGTMFANSSMMDVKTFAVDGKTKGWCDHCKTMDGCAVKQSSEM